MSTTTSRGRRRRSARAAFLLLSLTVSLTVSSGCGGSDEPGIPRATAEALAERSDRVATLLADGDRCAAAHEADRLLDQSVDAINEHRVPERFQEELLAAANELVDTVNCPPPMPVVEEDEDRGKGKNGKGKGKNGGED